MPSKKRTRNNGKDRQVRREIMKANTLARKEARKNKQAKLQAKDAADQVDKPTITWVVCDVCHKQIKAQSAVYDLNRNKTVVRCQECAKGRTPKGTSFSNSPFQFLTKMSWPEAKESAE